MQRGKPFSVVSVGNTAGGRDSPRRIYVDFDVTGRETSPLCLWVIDATERGKPFSVVSVGNTAGGEILSIVFVWALTRREGNLCCVWVF